MTGQQERAPGRPRAPWMRGVNRVCVEWGWSASLTENISDTVKPENEKMRSACKVFTAATPSFRGDPRPTSGLPEALAASSCQQACRRQGPIRVGLGLQLLWGRSCAAGLEMGTAHRSRQRNWKQGGLTRHPRHSVTPRAKSYRVPPASKILCCVCSTLCTPSHSKHPVSAPPLVSGQH